MNLFIQNPLSLTILHLFFNIARVSTKHVKTCHFSLLNKRKNQVFLDFYPNKLPKSVNALLTILMPIK